MAAQRHFDWITGAFVQAVLPDNNDLGPAVGVIYSLVDSAQLDEKGDNLVVERVVGSTLVAVYDAQDDPPSGGVPPVYELVERIYVCEADAAGEPDNRQDLFDPADFDRSWLWERRRLGRIDYADLSTSGSYQTEALRKQNSLGETYDSPYFALIDCNVKRRLKDREMLVYDVQVQFTNLDAGAQYRLLTAPRLRVGVTF